MSALASQAAQTATAAKQRHQLERMRSSFCSGSAALPVSPWCLQWADSVDSIFHLHRETFEIQVRRQTEHINTQRNAFILTSSWTVSVLAVAVVTVNNLLRMPGASSIYEVACVSPT